MTDSKELSPQAQAQIEVNRIRKYLRALESTSKDKRPTAGRKTREWIESRVEVLPTEIDEADDPVKRLLLTQELMDRVAELQSLPTAHEFKLIEEEFLKVAKAFSERKGVSYAAWRNLNVEPDVLERAGIRRGS